MLAGLVCMAIVHGDADHGGTEPIAPLLSQTFGFWWAISAGLGGYLVARLRERYRRTRAGAELGEGPPA